MFPSGSITGAPKIRTMQIIHEMEQAPRGIYTGAIGYISPNGSSTFNVAIRTLVLKDGEARMGVGGGIVADSEPSDEYRECLLKAEFLVRPPRDFQLIETMLWDWRFLSPIDASGPAGVVCRVLYLFVRSRRHCGTVKRCGNFFSATAALSSTPAAECDRERDRDCNGAGAGYANRLHPPVAGTHLFNKRISSAQDNTTEAL